MAKNNRQNAENAAYGMAKQMHYLEKKQNFLSHNIIDQAKTYETIMGYQYSKIKGTSIWVSDVFSLAEFYASLVVNEYLLKFVLEKAFSHEVAYKVMMQNVVEQKGALILASTAVASIHAIKDMLIGFSYDISLASMALSLGAHSKAPTLSILGVGYLLYDTYAHHQQHSLEYQAELEKLHDYDQAPINLNGENAEILHN